MKISTKIPAHSKAAISSNAMITMSTVMLTAGDELEEGPTVIVTPSLTNDNGVSGAIGSTVDELVMIVEIEIVVVVGRSVGVTKSVGPVCLHACICVYV